MICSCLKSDFLPSPQLGKLRLCALELVVEQPHRIHNLAKGRRGPCPVGLPEGEPLPRSIIEFYYKDDKLGDPLVSEEHITAFNWASTQEIDDMLAMTLRVNDFLTGLFGAVGITLVDFKLEFGRLWENEEMRIRGKLFDTLCVLVENAGRLVRKDELKLVFGDGSWICYRVSGTESVVRVYSEAANASELSKLSAAAKQWIFE